MLYSKRFLACLEKIAADPPQAARAFQDEWFAPYRTSLRKTRSFVHNLTSFADGSRDETLEQLGHTAGMIAQAMDIDGSWASAVRSLLETTADISLNLTLDSKEANSWAQGKAWLAGSSLPIPNSKWDPLWAFISRPSGRDRYAFVARSAGVGVGAFPAIPVKFSWRIGDTAATSPFPFVSSSALPPETTLQWSAQKDGQGKWSVKTTPVGDFAALRSGALPVHAVAASSSAVMAGTTMGMLNTMVRSLNPVGFMRLPTYFAVNPGDDGDAYTVADRIFDTVLDADATNEDTLTSLGQAAVVPTYDGAYTENTGIGHAVAAGASSVTAFLNDPLPFFELFAEESIKTCPFFGHLKRACFGLFTFPDSVLPWHVFASDHAKGLVDGFDQLSVVHTELVESLRVGQMQVLTRANEWFGIEEGRPVNLTLVLANITLPGLAGQGAPLLKMEDITIVAEMMKDITTAMSDPKHEKYMDMLVQSMKR
jgi:hypothetical protein